MLVLPAPLISPRLRCERFIFICIDRPRRLGVVVAVATVPGKEGDLKLQYKAK